MCGNASADVLEGVGIKLGEKLAEQAIRQISGKALTRINQTVGFRLIAKSGQKSLINAGKMVPLIGGVVGGAFDAASTQIIGTIARKIFVGTGTTFIGMGAPAED